MGIRYAIEISIEGGEWMRSPGLQDSMESAQRHCDELADSGHIKVRIIAVADSGAVRSERSQ